METPLSGVTSAAQHLAWRKQAPRLTYSRRPFFPAHRPSVKMVKMTTSASGKKRSAISPCAASSSAMPEESARAVPAAKQNELKTHQFILMCSGTRVNRRHQHTHGTGQLQPPQQICLRLRERGDQFAGNLLVFQIFPSPRSHLPEQRMVPCKAQMRPPCNFRSPAFSSGSWLPASRTGCTPASRHIRRKRARFSNPSSRQGLSRVSLRSPHTTRWEHPSRRNPSSSGSRASALAWPKWMSEINLARSPEQDQVPES